MRCQEEEVEVERKDDVLTGRDQPLAVLSSKRRSGERGLKSVLAVESIEYGSREEGWRRRRLRWEVERWMGGSWEEALA